MVVQKVRRLLGDFVRLNGDVGFISRFFWSRTQQMRGAQIKSKGLIFGLQENQTGYWFQPSYQWERWFSVVDLHERRTKTSNLETIYDGRSISAGSSHIWRTRF